MHDENYLVQSHFISYYFFSESEMSITSAQQNTVLYSLNCFIFSANNSWQLRIGINVFNQHKNIVKAKNINGPKILLKCELILFCQI